MQNISIANMDVSDCMRFSCLFYFHNILFFTCLASLCFAIDGELDFEAIKEMKASGVSGVATFFHVKEQETLKFSASYSVANLTNKNLYLNIICFVNFMEKNCHDGYKTFNENISRDEAKIFDIKTNLPPKNERADIWVIGILAGGGDQVNSIYVRKIGVGDKVSTDRFSKIHVDSSDRSRYEGDNVSSLSKSQRNPYAKFDNKGAPVYIHIANGKKQAIEEVAVILCQDSVEKSRIYSSMPYIFSLNKNEKIVLRLQKDRQEKCGVMYMITSELDNSHYGSSRSGKYKDGFLSIYGPY
ncbi:Hypothetical protein HDN1F_32490 [gamma proteobacterium HdN1]|nr:Hypothetical protein HDN1F_32490 [gamma proteobacterium HdN1]